jgi:hypothetical protein
MEKLLDLYTDYLLTNVTQQVLYAPFGEVLSDYNAYWDNENIPDYLFNAKECEGGFNRAKSVYSAIFPF